MGKRIGILFGVLLGTHLAWRVVRYALQFPVWGDEAFVIASLWDRGYGELFAPLEYGQIAPLAWLWLEKACFDLFGPQAWALRLPAFVAGLASAVLMLGLARRALPAREALLGFAIFAASYYPMRHGAEIKPYSTDLLWALLMLTVAWRATGARWVVLAGLTVSAPWISLSATFPAAAITTWALVRAWRARRGRGLAAAWAVAFAASAGAMAWTYAAPHAAAADWLPEMAMWEPTFPPMERPWLIPGWLLERHCGYMSAYPTGGRDWGSTATFVLVVAGTVRLWRRGWRARLWLLLGPLAFNFAAAALGRYPYGGSVRVSIFMAPAFCLLAGVGVAALVGLLRARPARLTETALVALLAAVPVAGIVADLREPYKLISDRRAEEFAASLGEDVASGDRVIVFAHGAADGGSEAGAAGGVDFHALGGSLARLRFQLRRALPVPVEWGAAPVDAGPAPAAGDDAGSTRGSGDGRGARTWLLAYVDDREADVPFPAEAFERYRQRWLDAGWIVAGAPRREPLRHAERVDVWRLAPSGDEG